MIRITGFSDSGKTRLVLEGKLAGPGVCELEKYWLKSLQENEIEIDLTNVGFVDDCGKRLLLKMHSKGIHLISGRLMTKSLIAEIEGDMTSH